MELLGYIASFFIGLILGTLGSGGSILSIPILVYLFSLDVVAATGYSLFIVGITSVAGAAQRYRVDGVNMRVIGLFGMPSLVAIFATRKWFVPSLPEVIVETPTLVISRRLLILGLFALLMIVAALLMIVKKRNPRMAPRSEKPILLALQGSIIGFLSGLIGAGGGFLIVPALVFLANIPFKSAVGTTLVLIAMNSLIGFLGDLLNYPIDWALLLSLSAIAVLGIFAGNYFSRRVPSNQLKLSFGWVTLVMGIGILLKECFYS